MKLAFDLQIKQQVCAYPSHEPSSRWILKAYCRPFTIHSLGEQG